MRKRKSNRVFRSCSCHKEYLPNSVTNQQSMYYFLFFSSLSRLKELMNERKLKREKEERDVSPAVTCLGSYSRIRACFIISPF